MSSPVKCSIHNCSEAPYTASGMMNFACKFWKQKEQRKQEAIALNIERNSQYAEEAREKQFDLGKLINIRNKMRYQDSKFREPTFLQTKNAGMKAFEGIVTKAFFQQQELEQLNEISNICDSIQQYINSDAHLNIGPNQSQRLKEIQQQLRQLADSASFLEQEFSRKNKSLQKEVKRKFEALKIETQEEAEFISDLVANNSTIPKGNLVSFVRSYDLTPEEDDYFNHFILYQRFLVRRKLVESPQKYYFLITKDLAIIFSLFLKMPNVFHIAASDLRGGKYKTSDYACKSRINLISSLQHLRRLNLDDVQLIKFDRDRMTHDSNFDDLIRRAAIIRLLPYFELEIFRAAHNSEHLIEFSDPPFFQDSGATTELINTLIEENELERE